MFTKHVSQRMAALLDGQVTEPEARRAELHLRDCMRCQAEYEKVRVGMTIVKNLITVDAPPEIWPSIEAGRQAPRVHQRHWAPALAVVALAVLAAVGVGYWRLGSSPGGSWIETGGNSHTTIRIGEIGFVEVEPNTRLRVVTEGPNEHRLALARGEIRAKISAPPKLFFVDTPSGTAVDLGCEYSLNTDDAGSDFLHVTRGWVSFQWKGMESLVPAGASCRTRTKAGPGIPYFDDAPENLKDALEKFAFGPSSMGKTDGDVLNVILSESRQRDTLTLWHLLSRVAPGDRPRVFGRMTALTPLPAGVSREKALALDPQTLTHWREELAWTW
jgi:ferric-dicitrate binding protein FerR (iron transport regulator)